MNAVMENFNLWIKRHKLFALTAPIVVLLLVFFVTKSIDSMGAGDANQIRKGYNDSLPNQKRELQVRNPNEIYKKAQQDSLNALAKKGSFNTLLDSKKENDSLERILEELNSFSLDDLQTADKGTTDNLTKPKPDNMPYVSKKAAAREKLEYQKLLMEARDERLSRSQDYSAPYSGEPSEPYDVKSPIVAAIYRDQFILPGNRVTLILKEDVFLQGRKLPKNTFVYAVSNIQGSRVLLEVTNISNLQIHLMAKDQQDGMIGLHNERAGELLLEFKADAEQQGVNELSEAVGDMVETPLAKNLVRSFGNFFQKKKYKQQDKILLVNGDRVFLVPKT